MDVRYINPFIEASKSVLKDICGVELTLGKPHMTKPIFENDGALVNVGITGDFKGQAIFELDSDVAKDLASKMMMGMPVDELNDMAKSAISELSNMILGNTMTVFSMNEFNLDITPPSIVIGKEISMDVSNAKIICVPLSYGDKTFNLNIALQV